MVVRQIDGGAPQPPQRFSPSLFLDWAKKQTALAQQVYSCYEAGPLGYSLHRKLESFGLTNYVTNYVAAQAGVSPAEQYVSTLTLRGRRAKVRSWPRN